MKDDNAQIVIDVVMGELQKKESFSSSLAKVAKDAINKGLEKASKARRTALGQAITDGIYKETPASKRAIKKLAKTTTLEVNKAIENYNAKHQSKGGFWNFVGSLAVNTGILRFGQGYKGGNFFRDRYLDTYRTMDNRGRITESSKVNYGRVAGDILSAGQFLVNAVTGLANLVNKGMERIEPTLNEGLSNAQEIITVAKSIGLKETDDLRGVAAAVNTIDSLMAGTNIKNLTSMLAQYFNTEKGASQARQAGFRGITSLDMTMEYVQALQRGQIFNKKGELINMSDKQKKALEDIKFTMNTPETRRKIREQVSVIPEVLFNINGGRYKGQDTLYTRAYNKSGGAELSSENYSRYIRGIIEGKLEKSSVASRILLSNTKYTENVYKELLAGQREALERELNYFENNLAETLKAQRATQKATENVKDAITSGATKIVNAIIGNKNNDNIYSSRKSLGSERLMR